MTLKLCYIYPLALYGKSVQAAGVEGVVCISMKRMRQGKWVESNCGRKGAVLERPCLCSERTSRDMERRGSQPVKILGRVFLAEAFSLACWKNIWTSGGKRVTGETREWWRCGGNNRPGHSVSAAVNVDFE